MSIKWPFVLVFPIVDRWLSRLVFPLAAVLLATTASAQLEVTHGPVGVLPVGSEVKKVGDRFLVRSPGALNASPAEIIFVETEAENVDVTASDQSRAPVEVSKISRTEYLLETPGTFWVEVSVIDFAKNIYGRKTVVVEVGQGPNPPPGPTPGPTPGPAPIDGAGLRVLIVYESSEANSLSTAHQKMMYGPTLRDYLNRNCVVGDDGRTPDWRLIDKDTTFTDQNHRFAKALARPRTQTPWLIVSNGTNGFEGPLPSRTEEVISLIEGMKRPSRAAATVAPLFQSYPLPTVCETGNCPQ